jgi:hypothetical protein
MTQDNNYLKQQTRVSLPSSLKQQKTFPQEKSKEGEEAM